MIVVRYVMLVHAMLLMCGCRTADRNLAFTAHIEGDLPPTATLLHAGAQYAGFDASYGFVFSVTDDALLEQLITEWKLGQSDSPSESGFFGFAKYDWWPTAELSGMLPNYSRSDAANEEYWIVWPDPKSGRLYVERGRW